MIVWRGLSPHETTAKGREWDLVAIAGLQEGAWPNLKQRSSLLGAERLDITWLGI